jgi:hypothetical protein
MAEGSGRGVEERTGGYVAGRACPDELVEADLVTRRQGLYFYFVPARSGTHLVRGPAGGAGQG